MTHVITVGNSGVGKSFCCNILLGGEHFVHQLSPTSVTAKMEFVTKQVGKNYYIVYNVPGLIESDHSLINRNKTEINKAFAIAPTCVVVYVFAAGSGRISDEDIQGFQALDKVYNFQRPSLCFIVNDLPNISHNYTTKTTQLIQERLNIRTPLNILFFPRIDHSDRAAQSKIQLEFLAAIAKCVPNRHSKSGEVDLKSDQLKKLEEQKRQQELEQQRQLEAQRQREAAERARVEQLRAQPPPVQYVHVHHHHDDDDGGCLVM